MLKEFFSNKKARMYTILIGGVILIIGLLSLIAACTSDANRLVYKIKEDGTYEVKDIKNIYRGGIFLEKKLVIPNEYKGIKVTSIKRIESEYLHEIVISEGIESIDAGAFGGMKLLEKVTIPASVKLIGDNAFKSCDELDNVVIPSGIKSINKSVFYKCYNLKNIEIPSSVNTISESAFEGCISLSKIVLSSNITNVNDYAFKDCTALKEVECDFSAIEFGSDVFGNTLYQKDICEKNNGFFLINNVLYGYITTNSYTVTIPDNCIKINSGTFNELKKDTSNDVERDVEFIIPASVKEIEEKAFNNCSSIKKIVFKGDCLFSSASFYLCNSMKQFYFDFSRSELNETTLANISKMKGSKVFIEDEKYQTYVYLTREDLNNKVETLMLFDTEQVAAYKIVGENEKNYFDQDKYQFYKLVDGKKEYLVI